MRSARDYTTITAAYWAFTVTDGALRMLVLLHLHELGRSPIEIVSLFLIYELFGIVTNLVGGWIGARFGLKATLLLGLSLQVGACTILAAMADGLSTAALLLAQGFAGVAKDLTKMSSKSYIKLVVPDADPRGLMRWVSILTGSKNALKGAGFFLGGVLLTAVGFRGACVAMAGSLALALVLAMITLPAAPGKVKGRIRLHELIAKDRRLRWLSAARLFLFGSRDVWFVLALPVYLASSLSWSFHAVGAFLALWVIGYGVAQAAAPTWIRAGGRQLPNAAYLGRWTAVLVVPLVAIPIALRTDASQSVSLIAGLAVFGIFFAANSAMHSYLVVAYAERDRVSLDVGFYYMANAVGRFVGTLLSGAVFQIAGSGRDGLEACLAVSVAFVVISAALCVPLRQAERRNAAAYGSHKNPSMEDEPKTPSPSFPG